MPIFGVFWYVPTAAVLSAPFLLLGRSRLQLTRWDSAVFFLPCVMWSVLAFANIHLELVEKAETNMVVEPLGLAVAAPVYFLARLILARRFAQRSVAISLNTAAAVLAVATVFVVPRMG